MNNSLDRVSRKVLERFTDLLGFVVSLKVVCVFFAVALASTLNAQDSDAEVVDAAFASALTVDGNASDWANLSSGVVTMDTSIRGDNGTLAVDIRYAWDDTNMYILVQENSNGALSTNAQEAANGGAYLKEFWLFDCIAFWIDLDNTSGTEVNGNIVAAGNADFQPWFGFSSSGRTDLIYGRANNTGDQNLDGLENGKVATGGTFAAHNRTIEVAIAWADIAATVGSDRQPGGDLESVIAPGYIFGSDPLLLNNDYEGQAFIGPEQYEAPSGTDSDSRDIRLVAQDSDAAPPKPDNGWVFSDQAGETAAPTFGDAGGTLSGGVTWDTDDPFGSGGSVSFDGTDGTVVMEDLAEAFNGLANFSFSIWIKSNATGIDKGFWEAVDSGGGDLWGLRYDSTGATAGGSNVIKLGITTSESGGNTNSGADQQESHEDTQTTEWQNIVMTWEDGEGFNLYLDGELDEPTSEMQTTSGTLEMMDRFVLGDGAKAYWDGLIDEVAVWSSTLSADDAAWLSKNSIAKLDGGATVEAVPGLIAYWPFDGDLDDAVGDSHGTGMGSDQIEFVSGQFGDGIALDGIDQFVEIAAENEEMFDFQ
ncbi:MAG TPA: hypothetical protein DCQ11_10980, partial [Gammaproteobacteria bacterium]|nr:hypothetical protein [Gammaproteobacteria bacterium]